MKTLIGKKIGMSQVFTDDALLPVTLIEVGPCVVTQIKDEEKDGYRAVQLGFSDVKDKHLNKPLKGHFAKASVKPTRHLAEYRLNKEEEAPQIGATLSCNIFEAGEIATVSAVSKGKGFQGVVKRWGFAGGPGGHGSHFHRTPGSIGMAATPSRVFKGTKMAGRMGGNQVTVKNLEIVKVDENQNIILVKGAVPGGKGALVVIKATGKTVQPAKLTQVGSSESGVGSGKLDEKKQDDVGRVRRTRQEEQKAKEQEPKVEEPKAEQPKAEMKEEQKTEEKQEQPKEEANDVGRVPRTRQQEEKQDNNKEEPKESK